MSFEVVHSAVKSPSEVMRELCQYLVVQAVEIDYSFDQSYNGLPRVPRATHTIIGFMPQDEDRPVASVKIDEEQDGVCDVSVYAWDYADKLPVWNVDTENLPLPKLVLEGMIRTGEKGLNETLVIHLAAVALCPTEAHLGTLPDSLDGCTFTGRFTEAQA